MVVIHPLRICYQESPKLASTALFIWLYRVLHDREPGDELNYIHDYFRNNKEKSLIEYRPDQRKSDLPGYYFFTVTRDPVKRLISAYRNRVLHFNELDRKDTDSTPFNSQGLRYRPEINHFVQNLAAYRAVDASISHHTDPMYFFTGEDLSRYDRIYDISETGLLVADLREHWRKSGIKAYEAEMGRAQDGGPKMGLNALTEESVKMAIDFYRRDYQIFKAYSPGRIMEEWHEHCGEKTPCKEVERIDLEVLATAADRIQRCSVFQMPTAVSADGRLSKLAAVCVPVASSSKGRIVVIDADGEIYPDWRDSPKLAEEISDNPHARQAKFIVDGLRLSHTSPVRCFLQVQGIGRIPLFQIVAI